MEHVNEHCKYSWTQCPKITAAVIRRLRCQLVGTSIMQAVDRIKGKFDQQVEVSGYIVHFWSATVY